MAIELFAKYKQYSLSANNIVFISKIRFCDIHLHKPPKLLALGEYEVSGERDSTIGNQVALRNFSNIIKGIKFKCL